MRVVHDGFKNLQKVVFVSLKNTKKSNIFVAFDFVQNFSFDVSFSLKDTYSLKIWRAPVYSSRK